MFLRGSVAHGCSTCSYVTNQLNFVEKAVETETLKKIGSSHIYASFGTFCVQIGQLFEAQ